MPWALAKPKDMVLHGIESIEEDGWVIYIKQRSCSLNYFDNIFD